MTAAGERTDRRRRREFSPLGALALSAALLVLGYYRRFDERAATSGAPRDREAAPEAERARVVERERFVSEPSEIAVRGEGGIVRRVARAVSEHRVSAVAAGVAFYSLLAIFPAIAGAAALYTLAFDPPAITAHLQRLSGVLPAGTIAFIGEKITRIAAQDQTTRIVAGAAGLLVALWSANAGMKAVFDALDVVHEERRKRGSFALNAVSLTFTLLGALSIAAAVAVIVGWPTAMAALDLGAQTERLAGALRWPLLVLLVSLAISLVYRFGPSRPRAQWQWLSLGSLSAALGWLAISVLFSVYAENIGRFDPVYGALGAIFGFMLWLWLSNFLLITGSELDAQTEVVAPED